MKTIQGNLITLAQDGAFDLIAHGCNCFCTMGAGIAKGIAQAFPEAQTVDRQTTKGDKAKVGTCTFANVQTARGSLIVVNAYTQYHYAGSGNKADYDGIRRCMRWIAQNYPKARIGLPKIGAGLAGGDWRLIEKIIAEELSTCDVTIVEYKP